MKKMKIKLKPGDLPKRRNPEFLAAAMRNAGRHEKPYRVKRRVEKAQLKKEYVG
jgi:hypothetical protein